MAANGQKSILVTGGFGFIGSQLVEMLLRKRENRVHVVDSMVTSPIGLDSYLQQLQGSDRLSYDLCTVREFFAKADIPNFDEIYHLASVVGPVGVLKHSGIILRDMVGDTYDLINYCLDHGTKLCDISTSEVYGGGRDGYCCEK